MKCAALRLVYISWSLLFFFVQFAQVVAEALCCNRSVFVVNGDNCANGQEILPWCDGDRLLLHLIDNDRTFFVVKNDEKGKYLEFPIFGRIVRQPYFCIGADKYEFRLSKKNNTVAVVCLTDRINESKTSDKPTETNRRRPEGILKAFSVVSTASNLVSGLFLAATSFVYFLLPQTKDVEGQCTCHLTLTLSLLHTCLAYKVIFNGGGTLSASCIIQLYVTVYPIFLSVFSWSSVLSHHMWNRFRDNKILEESKLMVRYLLVGYGIPSLLGVFSSIHVPEMSLHPTNAFEQECMAHQTLVIVLYTSLIISLLVLANGFFFIDLQRRLWNVLPSNLRGQKSSQLKKAQYRLTLNLKLFVIIGLPWLVILPVHIFHIIFESNIFSMLQSLTFIIFSVEGIFIFFTMVIIRRRVCRSLVDKLGITRWRPAPDAEESVEIVYENYNVAGAKVHIDFPNSA